MRLNKVTFLLVSFCVISVSCSGLNKYYSKLETLMIDRDYQQAQSFVDISKSAYGSKNKLLYYLDLGLTEHYSNNYQKSNEAFEQAKQIYELNYTKSISQATFSIFSNDNVITYYGNAYEMAYANMFCALNYILLGQNNEAVVEARQVDNLFKKINTDSNGKAFYKDDAFIRYFMGIVYENAGYYNDALISYKLALRNYNIKKSKYNVQSIPQDLLYRLYSMYNKFSMYEEANTLKQNFKINTTQRKSNEGELIIVDYNGLSPKKVDDIIAVALFDAWPYFLAVSSKDREQAKVEEVKSAFVAGLSNDFIKVAFPKYISYKNEINSFYVEEVFEQKNKDVNNVSNISSTVCDLGSLMIAILENQKLAIYAKTIARAVGRYVLAKIVSEKVKKQNGDLGTILNMTFNVANSLIEKADKRSWVTLPETINMLTINLPEGHHVLNINFLNSSKEVVTTQQIEVDIIANKLNFAFVNSFKYVR